jgi:hypothetical protein
MATARATALLASFVADSAEGLTPRVRGGHRRVVTRIEVSTGTKWDELRLVIDDLNLWYVINDKRDRIGFAEAGFEDGRRRGLPNDSWCLLGEFAKCGGRPLQMAANRDGRQAAKQRVSKLRGRLQWLFKIAGHSITNVAPGVYAAAFNIRRKDGITLNVPAGTTWSTVSITETRIGRIRFTFETTERYLVFSDGQVTEFPRKKETAERSVPISQEHDLWLLGFLDEDGDPNRVGQALLDVLRAGGHVTREWDDSDMLKLSGILSHMTGLEPPPFRFEHNQEVWTAEFEAISERAAR